jgi:CxxC-x17-CxxC domain-containing protein
MENEAKKLDYSSNFNKKRNYSQSFNKKRDNNNSFNRKRDNNSSFNRKRDNNSSFNKKRRFDFHKKPKLYVAKCSECGKECKVPFKPAEGRSVYCDECFKKKRENIQKIKS